MNKDPEKVAAAYKGVVSKLKEEIDGNQPSKWLSRKFLLSIGLALLGFILVLLGKVGGMEYLVFVCGLSGIYVAGNVTQTVMQGPAN